MPWHCPVAGAIFVLIFISCQAEAEESEPAAVIELGGAAGFSLEGGGASAGPNLAIEVAPIENWLEIEAGVTPLFSHRGTEWNTDVTFKKPFDLTDRLEFAIGIGPEWVHTSNGGKSTDSLAGEAIVELAFWPHKQHDFGWYLEPSYDYDFGRGHEQSLSLTVGLRIGIP